MTESQGLTPENSEKCLSHLWWKTLNVCPNFSLFQNNLSKTQPFWMNLFFKCVEWNSGGRVRRWAMWDEGPGSYSRKTGFSTVENWFDRKRLLWWKFDLSVSVSKSYKLVLVPNVHARGIISSVDTQLSTGRHLFQILHPDINW